MAISYLSKNISPGVLPEQSPIELIAQVAQQKQVKYDTMLTAIMGQYENLLSLDASSNDEAQAIYNQKMTEANKSIASLAKLDLMNPDNASKIENVFSPILNDKYIMTAVAATKERQKIMSVYEHWQLKKPELYNARNHEYTLLKAQENKTMSLEDFMTSRNQLSSIEYVDRDKFVIDRLKGTDLEVSHSVTTPSGKYWVTKTNKSVTEEDLKALFPRDSKFMAQTQVDAFFTYSKTSDKDLLSEFNQNFNSAIYNYREVNQSLLTGLSQLDKDITNAKANQDLAKIATKYGLVPEYTTQQDLLEYLEDKKEKIEISYKQNENAATTLLSQQTDFFDDYGVDSEIGEKGFNIVSFSPLSKSQRESLSTQILYNEDASRFAKALSKNSQTLEIKDNPDYIAQRNHEYKIEEMKFASKLKIIEERVKNDNSASTNSGSGGVSTPSTSGFLTEVGHVLNTEMAEKMSLESFNNILTGLTKSKQSLRDEYVKSQLPNGTSQTDKLTEQSLKKLNTTQDLLLSFEKEFAKTNKLTDDTSINIGGGAVMTYGDFKREYAVEIQTLNEEKIIEQTQKIYTDLYSELEQYANTQLNARFKPSPNYVADQHYTVTLDFLKDKGTVPFASDSAIFGTGLTKLDSGVKSWLTNRLSDPNTKNIPLSDEELRYLFHNGRPGNYESIINAYTPNEFNKFKEAYKRSITPEGVSESEKIQARNKIIDEELGKLSLLEMNPEFLVMQKSGEENKDNLVNKFSSDFAINITNAIFQQASPIGVVKGSNQKTVTTDAGGSQIALDLGGKEKPIGSKDITSVRIRQIGENFYAYLFADNKLINQEGFRLPEGLKNQYQSFLPVHKTNILLDAMERVFAYQGNPNARMGTAPIKVELPVGAERWFIGISGTNQYTIGKAGEKGWQNKTANRNQLLTLLYENNPQNLGMTTNDYIRLISEM